MLSSARTSLTRSRERPTRVRCTGVRDRAASALAQVAAECAEGEGLADAAAVAHRVDDAAGCVVRGDGLSQGCFEPFDAEGEGLRGVLRHHGRRVGKSWGVVNRAARRCVLLRGCRRSARAGPGRTRRARRRVEPARTRPADLRRGLRCVRPPVDPPRDSSSISPSATKDARSREGESRAHQPPGQTPIPWDFPGTFTPAAGTFRRLSAG